MRASTICVGLGGLLALAACGGPDKGDGNAASAEKNAVAPSASGENEKNAMAPSASGEKMRPGQWEMAVQTVSVEAPNMPKQVADMMAARQKMTTRNCITPQQAQNPGADMFRGKKDGNCTYENFSVSGGRVKGTMTCKGGDQPGAVTLEMDGRYDAESYDISQKMTMAMQGMSMKIDARVTGRRIGDCPAGAQG